MTHRNETMTALAVYAAIILVVAWGWILNILALVDLGMDNLVTIEGILRVGGVFVAPVGAVLGFFV